MKLSTIFNIQFKNYEFLNAKKIVKGSKSQHEITKKILNDI